MNFREASALAYFDLWENANPYDNRCDEERCVKGICCPECNAGKEYQIDLKEYKGVQDDCQE